MRGNEITGVVFSVLFPNLYIVVNYKNMVFYILNIVHKIFVSVSRQINRLQSRFGK